jgi:hypothetical protein
MDALTRRSALTVTDVAALDHLVKESLRRRYQAARRTRGE